MKEHQNRYTRMIYPWWQQITMKEKNLLFLLFVLHFFKKITFPCFLQSPPAQVTVKGKAAGRVSSTDSRNMGTQLNSLWAVLGLKSPCSSVPLADPRYCPHGLSWRNLTSKLERMLSKVTILTSIPSTRRWLVLTLITSPPLKSSWEIQAHA